MATLVQEKGQSAKPNAVEREQAFEREMAGMAEEVESKPSVRRGEAKIYYTMPLPGVKYYSFKPRVQR
jgi:hypothetical protein